MTMKLEEVIAGKSDQESVSLDGLAVPVAVLRNLSQEGYVNLRFYKDNNTFSLWGKNCTVCFTFEQIQKKMKSK
jgi:hypothetical protein